MSITLQDLIAEQKRICESVGSRYIEVNGDDIVAVAVDSLKQEPWVGLRKAVKEQGDAHWYIYGGELTEASAVFETMQVRDLQDLDAVDVLPYLALEVGFRFMIDSDEYEDIWREGDL